MQARFDFAGTIIPPTEDLPTHLGLHHHGEEPQVRQLRLNLFTSLRLNVPALNTTCVFLICLLTVVSSAGRLFPAGTVLTLSESVHPTEESGS